MGTYLQTNDIPYVYSRDLGRLHIWKLIIYVQQIPRLATHLQTNEISYVYSRDLGRLHIWKLMIYV